MRDHAQLVAELVECALSLDPARVRELTTYAQSLGGSS